MEALLLVGSVIGSKIMFSRLSWFSRSDFKGSIRRPKRSKSQRKLDSILSINRFNLANINNNIDNVIDKPSVMSNNIKSQTIDNVLFIIHTPHTRVGIA